MVDGSHLPLGENILYTKNISSLAHAKGILVEAELGRLSGTEDGLTIEEYEARFTDIAQVISLTLQISTTWTSIPVSILNLHGKYFQAEKFIDETGIDALAVCIGNVHGKYPPSGPNLRLDLLKVRQMQSNYENLYVILVAEYKIFLRKHHCMEHFTSKLVVCIVILSCM